MGDFTDWAPVTMRMHPVDDVLRDGSLQGLFFVHVKLAKGYRYRFLFLVDGEEVVDRDDNLSSEDGKGLLTNYIDVIDDAKPDMTVEEFIS